MVPSSGTLTLCNEKCMGYTLDSMRVLMDGRRLNYGISATCLFKLNAKTGEYSLYHKSKWAVRDAIHCVLHTVLPYNIHKYKTLNSIFEERGKLAVNSQKEANWLSIQRKS